METTYTCQICERIIKAPLSFAKMEAGVSIPGRVPTIAHHRYQRPWKEGWQSGSCFGAKWRPYELASDALPPAIERAKTYIANQRKIVKSLMQEPPETLLESYSPMRREKKVYNRPEGFDEARAEKNLEGWGHLDDYETEHRNQVRSHKRNIEHIRTDLARMEERLSVWVASKN